MTREETIEELKKGRIRRDIKAFDDALGVAIEVLEQESVLDKIRADIEEYKSRRLGWAIGTEDLETGKQIALKYVLALIDEYKTESEDKK